MFKLNVSHGAAAALIGAALVASKVGAVPITQTFAPYNLSGFAYTSVSAKGSNNSAQGEYSPIGTTKVDTSHDRLRFTGIDLSSFSSVSNITLNLSVSTQADSHAEAHFGDAGTWDGVSGSSLMNQVLFIGSSPDLYGIIRSNLNRYDSADQCQVWGDDECRSKSTTTPGSHSFFHPRPINGTETSLANPSLSFSWDLTDYLDELINETLTMTLYSYAESTLNGCNRNSACSTTAEVSANVAASFVVMGEDLPPVIPDPDPEPEPSVEPEETVPVPEPGNFALLGLALLGIARKRRISRFSRI